MLDFTDHVWAEIWSDHHCRWVHVDACEGPNTYDNPLMYECGWGKKLTYVVAFGHDHVVDVTKRYTKQWSKVLERRDLVPEETFGAIIAEMDLFHQSSVGYAGKELLMARLVEEQVELERNIQQDDGFRKRAEKQGRVSGSLEWRTKRGEIGPRTKASKYEVTKVEDKDGKDVVSLELFSAGWNDGDHASIKVNGEELAPNESGLNLVLLNLEQGDYEVKWFDTSRVRDSGKAFAEFVKSVMQRSDKDTLVLTIASKGDARYALGDDGVDGFSLVGIETSHLHFKGSFVMAWAVNWVEFDAKQSGDGPASLDLSLSLR